MKKEIRTLSIKTDKDNYDYCLRAYKRLKQEYPDLTWGKTLRYALTNLLESMGITDVPEEK